MFYITPVNSVRVIESIINFGNLIQETVENMKFISDNSFEYLYFNICVYSKLLYTNFAYAS